MKYLWGSPFLTFTCLLAAIPEPAHALRVTGLSLGVGDWINVTDGDWDTREDYGTLPGTGVYFAGWGWNGSLGVPVKTSFKRIRHETRFSLGDGELTLGKKFGTWSPRTILRMPLYSWSVADASENELFIGSGNIKVGLGLGAKLPAELLPTPWNVGFDLEATTAVTEALAEYGSTQALGVLQATYALGRRWKVGANSLFLFDHWRWIPDYWDQKGETKFTIVPGVLSGTRLFRATYVDAKAGMSLYEYRSLVEPKYQVRPQASYYFSLSMFQGF